ncbi:nuclear transport factor 2 family protein [Pseudonocardia sp. DLS-67]
MTTTENDIRELGSRWAEAEQRGDVDALQTMSTADFTLVGPAGFVLEREQWFAGYRSGALRIQALNWDDVRVRDYGDTAVAIGVRTQEATYQGTPAGGRFRGTHIAARRDGRWLMAGVHLSPMVTPPA